MPFKKSALAPAGIFLVLVGIIQPLPLSRMQGLVDLQRVFPALIHASPLSWSLVLTGVACIGAGVWRDRKRKLWATGSFERSYKCMAQERQWCYCISLLALPFCLTGQFLATYWRLLAGKPPVWVHDASTTFWIASAATGVLYGVRSFHLAKSAGNDDDVPKAVAATVLNIGSLVFLGMSGALVNSAGAG